MISFHSTVIVPPFLFFPFWEKELISDFLSQIPLSFGNLSKCQKLFCPTRRIIPLLKNGGSRKGKLSERRNYRLIFTAIFFLSNLLFSFNRRKSWIIDSEYTNEKDVWHSCHKWKNCRFDEFLGLRIIFLKNKTQKQCRTWLRRVVISFDLFSGRWVNKSPFENSYYWEIKIGI